MARKNSGFLGGSKSYKGRRRRKRVNNLNESSEKSANSSKNESLNSSSMSIEAPVPVPDLKNVKLEKITPATAKVRTRIKKEGNSSSTISPNNATNNNNINIKSEGMRMRERTKKNVIAPAIEQVKLIEEKSGSTSCSSATPPLSPNSSGTGVNGNSSGAGANSRRIFTSEFKAQVIEAFNNDPTCKGNQRATARKFAVHRRQVQKWVQSGVGGGGNVKGEENSSSARRTETKNENKIECPSKSFMEREETDEERKMPIIGGKSVVHHIPSSTNTNGGSGSFPYSSTPEILMALNLIPTRNIISNNNNNSKINNNNNITSSLSKHLSSDNINNIPLQPPLTAAAKKIVSPAITYSNNSSSSYLNGPTITNYNNNNNNNYNNNNNSDNKMSPSLSHNLNFNSNNNNNNSFNNNHNVISTLDLVDELTDLYPNDDFSLLKRALLKNEISFFKLSPPRINYNNNSETIAPSPSTSTPIYGKQNNNDYMAQQLELLKQQSDYLKLLQHSGLGLKDHSKWFPLLAAGISNTAGATGSAGENGISSSPSNLSLNNNNNNNITNSNNKRQKSGGGGSNHHTFTNFTTPRLPTTSNLNGKSKTVAEALAASRLSPTRQAPRRRSSNGQSRKGRQSKSGKTSTITRPGYDQDHNSLSSFGLLDHHPSLLDVNNSLLLSSETGIDLSSGPKTNYNNHFNLGNNGNSNSSNSSGCQDLFMLNNGIRESLENYFRPNKASSTSTTNTTTTEVSSTTPTTTSYTPEEKRPQSLTTNTAGDLSESDKIKHLVLEAFTFDPEVAGDARSIARRFGLNVRVVMKWIKEAGSSSNGNGPKLDLMNSQYIINNKASSLTSSTTGVVNKRKNPNPNQICDFGADQEIDMNLPIDMVVPLKKRRVSTSPSPYPNNFNNNSY